MLKGIDFTKPILKMERVDSQDLREKILNLSYANGKIWDSVKVLFIT